MKIPLTSDLHQWIPKRKDLVKIGSKEKPRFILIAGDLLPKNRRLCAAKFFSEMKTHCKEIKRSASAPMLTYSGNDDFHIL
jgi:predicted phosphodiesterase